MEIYLYKRFLSKVFLKSCETTIPRSGEEGERVNCYVVSIDDKGTPYFMASNYDNGKINGLKWDGKTYTDEHSMSLTDFINGELRITHYYGLTTITYNSIYDFTWHYFTKLIYLKTRCYLFIRKINQYYFNKQKLVTKKRMDLLLFMMEDQLDRKHNGINKLDLMSKLYSIKWVLHPTSSEQFDRLELYLESLVISGELSVINHEYVVTGKAISTIEKYEEEERRHTEAVKLQKKMVMLTLILVIIAILQSGLIKFPTVLDFANDTKLKSHNKAFKLTP